jgi:hypothetical protein
MRTTRALTLLIALPLVLSGCSGTPQPEVTVTVTAEPTETSSASPEPSQEASPDATEVSWDSSLEVQLVEFSVSKAKCSYSDGSLEMRATVANISGRDIIAIDVAALINDVFGEEIMGMDLSSDKKLAAGESVNVGSWGNSCFSLNQFSSDHNRLLDMDDLDASTDVEFQVRKIAFSDGEIVEY